MANAKGDCLAKLIMKFSANSKKTSKQKQTRGFFLARKQLLMDYWNRYNVAIGDEESAEEEGQFFQVETAFCEALGEINDCLDDLSITTDSSTVNSTMHQMATLQTSSQHTILQKIEIPKFDGSFKKWLSFKDMFETCVIQETTISDVQRMHYLKSSLQGEAEAVLRNFSVTGTNFQTAWDLLQQRYDNKRRLVKSYMREIVAQSSMSMESASGLRQLLDCVVESVRALEQLGCPTQHWDHWLVFHITEKLDPVTVKDWEMSLESPNAIPEYQTLLKFLGNRIQGLDASSTSQKNKIKDNFGKAQGVRNHHMTIGRCPRCNEKHSLMYCPQFRVMPPDEKRAFVFKSKRCMNCLKADHKARDCKSEFKCQKCMQSHHTLLHDSSAAPTNGPVVLQSRVNQSNITNHHERSTSTAVLLATAIIGVRSPDDHILYLRALLDSGSQASFISEFCVQQLRLRKKRVKVPVLGVGGTQVGLSSGLVEFIGLSRTEPDFVFDCSALVLSRMGHLLPRHNVDPNSFSEFLGLSLADPKFYEPGAIDVIIGADLYGRLLLGEVKQSSTYLATAQNTHLGWVICGQSADVSSLHLYTTVCATTAIELSELVQQLWKFNEQDDAELPSQMTQDEIYCEDFFKQTVKRLSCGRYQVRYPIKEPFDPTALVGSRSDAFKLFSSQQRRLQNNPVIKELYEEFMAEYLSLGHMEHVLDDKEPTKVCYIPHHGVYKESSSTTKLRTVFNAARKFRAGVSLNDCLHVGPKLQNELCAIVLNWRFHRVAFMADIEKCYRQILVHSDDCDLQRIVWHDNHDKAAIFRLRTVTYGLNCSPYLTIKVLHTLATDEESSYPEAAEVLKEAFYMDDCLHGADTVEEAVALQRQLQELLRRGGFNLRKWISNSTTFMRQVKLSDTNNDNGCNVVLDKETKALGLYWCCDSDSLAYKVHVSPLSGQITKRQQLSDVAKIYDPPGFLAPVVVTGKILCQKLWLAGCGWDDPLPVKFHHEWLRFRSELNQINHIRIARWVGLGPVPDTHQLHVFADASTEAYAAVAYLRSQQPQGAVKVSMLMAKTRVAPLKKITVPCLELNAALLAAKLAAKIGKTCKLPMRRIHYWSDSKTTLSWIRSRPGTHKQYISNRLTKIQELTCVDSWAYVSTEVNPADVASRGIFPSELADSKLWWEGPPWLYEAEEQWTNQCIIMPINGDQEPAVTLTATAVVEPTLAEELLLRFSSINKLLAVTSWCYRFIAARRKTLHEQTSYITSKEREKALNFWIRYIQNIYFANEIFCLSRSKPISIKSKLLKLNPIMDENGLVRLKGRLMNASLPLAELIPIILPKDNPLCSLLIAQAHECTLHGGVQATLNFIRRRYWLIDGRSTVRKFINRCVICYRQRCSSPKQIMGNLPTHRVTATSAFTHCGLDYGGPYWTRTTKGRGHHASKGYVALFVCFSTRAVHLELVSDLTTDAFLAALRRFFAQRGYSSDIYSDNATTFVGANKVLKDEYASYRQHVYDAARIEACRGVTWHFIPPGAPNFGGIWEAGIKSMKHHLKRIIGEAKLTFEEFYTILKQVEAVLNSRPLSPLSDDPSDLTALTPGHFLVGRSLITPPEPSLLDISTNRLKRWKQLQQMHQDFWRRWSCEYLRELQIRRKWQRATNNVKTGALVLLLDERAPPNQWALGRVIEVHPGEDERVRVATIRTQTSIIKRAVSKLAVLPIED